MKKSYLPFLFLLLLSVSAVGQITLTSAANTPQIGDSFTYYGALSPTINVRNNGANQTWDFSSLTTIYDTVAYDDVANSTEPSSFPNATIVENSATSTEVFYEISSSELSSWSQKYSNDSRVNYTDKREVLKFPITYNDVFNETYAGTIFGNGTSLNLTGTISINAAGYGSLITSYGQVDDVLKIEVVSNYTYTGLPTNYVDTISLWYNAFTRSFIASTSYGYSDGSLFISSALCITQDDLVTGINAPTSYVPTSLYPNPASDFVQLKNTSNSSNIEVAFYGVEGALIKTEQTQGAQVDISDLKSGIYIVKYLFDDQYFVAKLVVE